MPCRHEYCFTCIHDWFKINPRCPQGCQKSSSKVIEYAVASKTYSLKTVIDAKPDTEETDSVASAQASNASGVPLSLFDAKAGTGGLRDLVEEGCYSTGSKRGLADFIPLVLESERDRIRGVLAGRKASMIFDGAGLMAPFEGFLMRSVDDTVPDLLEDAMCASVMLAYNTRERTSTHKKFKFGTAGAPGQAEVRVSGRGNKGHKRQKFGESP